MIPVSEIARQLGITKKAVKLRIKRNGLYFETRQENGQPCIYARLEDFVSTDLDRYPEVEQKYIASLLAGGVSDRHARYTQALLKRFWGKLGMSPSLLAVNVHTLHAYCDHFPPDPKNRRSRHDTRIKAKLALAGLAKTAASMGLLPSGVAEEIQGADTGKPKFSRVRAKPSRGEVETALAINASSGKCPHDKALMDILIRLYAFGGLRRFEACELTRDCLDIKNKMLSFWGKNGKQRQVIILPELEEGLVNWAAFGRKSSPRLLHKKDGSPLTEDNVRVLFQRFGKKPGMQNIKPHALRRFFATYCIETGLRMNHAQFMLGHASASTTALYIVPTLEDLKEWQASARAVSVPPPSTAGAPSRR